MSTSPSTIEFILDQLSGLDSIMARKMFGEYALYFEGKVVALICDDTFYLKITEKGREWVGKHYQEGFAYKGAKISMIIPEDLMENREWFENLIRITAENLPTPKPKKRKSAISQSL